MCILLDASNGREMNQHFPAIDSRPESCKRDEKLAQAILKRQQEKARAKLTDGHYEPSGRTFGEMCRVDRKYADLLSRTCDR
jgi:hypothetical protein